MKRALLVIIFCVGAAIAAKAHAADLLLRLAPEEFVQAGDADIGVLGYSVPSFVDWDNDGLDDLIVGEGSSSYSGKVRVYINTGTACQPQFDTFSYAKLADGSDLTCPGDGCLGCFPRVVYWDEDAKKDLLVGQADGTMKIFLNLGSDNDPNFDPGTFLKVGPTGSKTNIDVGSRATPCVVDWNNDGKKDILTGNTNGQLLFYSNAGTDSDPSFAGYEFVESDGVAIDLAGLPRSRPFVCDWIADGYPDVMIGASDGNVHLYQTIIPGDIDNDHDVDWSDFAALALYWGATDCGQCGGADLFDDDQINMLDVLTLAQHWLAGCRLKNPDL